MAITMAAPVLRVSLGLRENFDTVFATTALIFNNEHPAQIALQTRTRHYPSKSPGPTLNLPAAMVRGRQGVPRLKQIGWNAFEEFGQSVQMDESPASPASDLTSLQGRVNVVRPELARPGPHRSTGCRRVSAILPHRLETPEQVPWTGLQTSTRAFAKILQKVDKVPIEKLRK